MAGGNEVQMDKISRIKAFSFFVRLCRKHYGEENPGDRVSFVEFSKYCGERWCELSERQKFQFHVLDKKERRSNISDEEATHENEKSTKVKNRKNNSSGNYKGEKKGGVEPRKPRRPYMIFMKDQHAKSFNRVLPRNLAQATRKIAALWRQISPEEKARYVKLAESDKLRYEKELREYALWQKRNGIVTKKTKNEGKGSPV